MFVNLLFWYQFFCGFSGSVMSNSWVLILFNLVFTSAPPLIYSILDQDMPAETLLTLPELYRAVHKYKVTEHMAAACSVTVTAVASCTTSGSLGCLLSWASVMGAAGRRHGYGWMGPPQRHTATRRGPVKPEEADQSNFKTQLLDLLLLGSATVLWLRLLYCVPQNTVVYS